MKSVDALSAIRAWWPETPSGYGTKFVPLLNRYLAAFAAMDSGDEPTSDAALWFVAYANEWQREAGGEALAESFGRALHESLHRLGRVLRRPL